MNMLSMCRNFSGVDSKIVSRIAYAVGVEERIVIGWYLTIVVLGRFLKMGCLTSLGKAPSLSTLNKFTAKAFIKMCLVSSFFSHAV